MGGFGSREDVGCKVGLSAYVGKLGWDLVMDCVGRVDRWRVGFGSRYGRGMVEHVVLVKRGIGNC